MIVEITREQLVLLVHGEPVELGDTIVRIGAGGVLADRAQDVRERRREARAKLTGDPQFYMRAQFDGQCYAPGCRTKIAAGDRIMRDRAHGKTYCAPCGAQRYPNVRVPH